VPATRYKVRWENEVVEYHEAEIELPDGITPDDLVDEQLAGYESPQTQHSSETESRNVTDWEEAS
jgi:hypothetical protein